MSGKGFDRIFRFLKILCVTLIIAGVTFFNSAFAVDLPLASGSSLAGITFNDRPLALPIERNFQMAALTASTNIGRSCGKMEAYGWRMNQSEQSRVDKIFNDTATSLRDIGYKIEAQAPTSVSRDVTLFTADRNDKHFMLLWSAGDIGLVMILCESSPPLHNKNGTATSPRPLLSTAQSQAVVSTNLNPQKEFSMDLSAEFSPVGDWIGSYTCEQGYTGGTLHISRLEGKNFDGVFRFYPTPKNPSVPPGSYAVFGQYDRQSQRILINPGQWKERPRNYYNTIIVGSFDPIKRTFSGFFQGVTGCTSFEANYAGSDLNVSGVSTKKTPSKKKHKKKAIVHKMPVAPLSIVPDVSPIPETPAVPSPTPVPKKSGALEQSEGIVLAASGDWFTPQPLHAPQANVITPQPQQAPQAQYYNPNTSQVITAPQAPQPTYYESAPPQLPLAQNAPQPNYYNPYPPELPLAQQMPQAGVITPQAPTLPPAPQITIGAGAQ